MSWLARVQQQYSITADEKLDNLEELTNPNYRYTFDNKTLVNLDLPEGLYQTEFRGNKVVLKVDKWGEVRVARETPCNNVDKFAQSLVKYCV